jgi:hypothetical protein
MVARQQHDLGDGGELDGGQASESGDAPRAVELWVPAI